MARKFTGFNPGVRYGNQTNFCSKYYCYTHIHTNLRGIHYTHSLTLLHEYLYYTIINLPTFFLYHNTLDIILGPETIYERRVPHNNVLE